METAKQVILVLGDPKMSKIEIYGVVKSSTRTFEVDMIYTGRSQGV